jgi:hypothetical protein
LRLSVIEDGAAIRALLELNPDLFKTVAFHVEGFPRPGSGIGPFLPESESWARCAS